MNYQTDSSELWYGLTSLATTLKKHERITLFPCDICRKIDFKRRSSSNNIELMLDVSLYGELVNPYFIINDGLIIELDPVIYLLDVVPVELGNSKSFSFPFVRKV